MIVLDTNVISELMRQHPSGEVIAWLDRQPSTSVWTTSVCVFEIRMGLTLMDRGRRRDELQTRFEQVLERELNERVLNLDAHAATIAASLVGRIQAKGITLDLRDLFIAGIAASREATLATRNVKHFEHTGIRWVNPWEAHGR